LNPHQSGGVICDPTVTAACEARLIESVVIVVLAQAGGFPVSVENINGMKDFTEVF